MTRRVLMVYWHHGGGIRYAVERHIRALDPAPLHVQYLNAFARPPRGLRLAEFDAVVLHTVFLGMRWQPGFDEFRRRFAWLRDAAPTKIAIPQDEYDHSEVLDEWLAELGVDVVFTNFASGDLELLYPTLHGRARFVPALTGYIDEHAAERAAERARPPEDRPFDVVYRATRLPYWFGSQGQLKHEIAAVVQASADRVGLATDISTRLEDTVYGDSWLDFLLSGRATIGAESGSSVLDRRGEVQRRIEQLLAEEPRLTFEQVDARMPVGWDSYAFTAISPRHLEAVMTKTCQVLVEGSYDGILVPEQHYLPVRRDFSNLDDVLGRLRDVSLIREITERAYEDVYLRGSWTYRHFAEQLAAEVPERPFGVRRAIAPTVATVGRGVTRVETALAWRARALAASVARRS